MDKIEVIFKTPIIEEVINFKTGEKCVLVSNDNVERNSKNDIEKIVEICNQHAVYDFLFRTNLEGKPYIENNAKQFIQWIAEGWKEQKWFVFFVRDSHDEIVACIDIKSNDRKFAEVGYWADNNFPGIISNATAKVIELARKAGYIRLFALVKQDNERSKNVLMRTGFVFDGEIDKQGEKHFKFVVNLE